MSGEKDFNTPDQALFGGQGLKLSDDCIDATLQTAVRVCVLPVIALKQLKLGNASSSRVV
eukprot:10504-Heterococcus_DN1.PRE.2